jgi:hypothetical protein
MTLEFNIRYKVTAKAGKREVRACGARDLTPEWVRRGLGLPSARIGAQAAWGSPIARIGTSNGARFGLADRAELVPNSAGFRLVWRALRAHERH